MQFNSRVVAIWHTNKRAVIWKKLFEAKSTCQGECNEGNQDAERNRNCAQVNLQVLLKD